MVLKIEIASDGESTVLQLSGRMESQEVQDLKATTASIVGGIVFDLKEVRVVDLDAVHFLAVCEARGIQLRNCRPYIRKWILTETPKITQFELG